MKREMKIKLEQNRNILGTKVDLNWLKYKVTRNKRYLKKFNACVEQLVRIDQAIERTQSGKNGQS